MEKTKVEIVSYSPFSKTKIGSSWSCDFRERRSSFSLDLRSFGSSVLDGVRSKVVLCGEGYAWTPIWWSSENSKMQGSFHTSVILWLRDM